MSYPFRSLVIIIFQGELETEEEYVLAGLVSWGIGCAQPGYAGIYTDVSRYTGWVQQNMV